MAKPKILFYTDCYIFAGCEKPLMELLLSPDFSLRYDHKLFYRKTMEYDNGLEHFYPSSAKKMSGIRFPEPNTMLFFFERKIKNGILRKVFRKAGWISFRMFSLLIFAWEAFFLSFKFRAEKADIVHVNNGGYPGALSCRAAVVAAKLAGKKKVILSVHNMAIERRGPADRIIDLLVRRSVDVYVTGSKSSGRELSKIRGFEAAKMVNIYHGIKPLDTGSDAPADDRYKSDILMVAAMEERKGHAYVIRAVRRLIDNDQKFKDLKICFIGEGIIKGSIEKMIEEERLQDNIKLLGHRRDYARYLASTKMLLNPSIGYEDLPFVIIEAMSLGVPVIGTDIAGIPEEIEDGVSGSVVQPKDADALAEAIRRLLLDGQTRLSMGKEGRRIFREKFALDRMVGEYISLYNTIVVKR